VPYRCSGVPVHWAPVQSSQTPRRPQTPIWNPCSRLFCAELVDDRFKVTVHCRGLLCFAFNQVFSVPGVERRVGKQSILDGRQTRIDSWWAAENKNRFLVGRRKWESILGGPQKMRIEQLVVWPSRSTYFPVAGSGCSSVASSTFRTCSYCGMRCSPTASRLTWSITSSSRWCTTSGTAVSLCDVGVDEDVEWAPKKDDVSKELLFTQGFF